MFDAAAGAGRFEPSVSHVVVNEVFHLCHPLLFASCTVQAWRGFVLFLLPKNLFAGDGDIGGLAPSDVVIYETSS